MNSTENILFGEFPKNVIDQANAAARIRTSAFVSYRSDLRGKTVFAFADTPETPTESAYSLYRKGMGWQLGIHIADVCEYVCEGSPLDAEARKRKASVRGNKTKSEMLPAPIVQDLCNFTKNGDKLAISVLMDLDEEGNVENIELDESVIRISGMCVYNEIDQLQTASDDSAVMLLREKYSPFKNILDDMYELAAKFCMRRIQRGGLDCTRFYRVYLRDEQGKIVAFKRQSEPDSRAMLREIGYFAAECLGEYMLKKKLPCIFNGRSAIAKATLDYLSELVGVGNSADNSAYRVAQIAETAKGTPYYGFVCDAISAWIPCASFSNQPIDNFFCACDHVVSFFNPVTHYTDLLIQRTLKTAIAAGSAQNLNLNKQKKIVLETTDEANSAERFIFKARKQFASAAAIEYITNNIKDNFVGFPIETNQNGEVVVMLECGIIGTVPTEYTADFKYKKAQPSEFEVVSINSGENTVLLKPVI